MDMIDIVKKIFKEPVCNSCAGRQFAQLLSGYSNAERGKVLRTALAMKIDSGEKTECDMNNFFEYKFRFNKDLAGKQLKKQECSVCNGFFENIDKFASRVAKRLEKYEFNTFLIGTQLSHELLNREEEMWEKIGIDFCEPLRAEINREIGKRIESILHKKAELKNPDIAVLLDLENNRIKLQVNPLYIFGYYQKLVRGIPQCRWGTPRKYKTSVEQIIGKPLLAATKGKDHKLHGAGREDISARCLAWRPFVIEIEKPLRRRVDLKKIERKVSGSIRVKGLRLSDSYTVKKIKEAKPDKTYKVVVKLNKPVEKAKLKKLKSLVGIINQRTPQRVLHRRSDLLRKREVKAVKWRQINKKIIELTIKASAGLYVKELVSGDNGRTKPSVAELLGCETVCKDLDVVGIGKIKA